MLELHMQSEHAANVRSPDEPRPSMLVTALCSRKLRQMHRPGLYGAGGGLSCSGWSHAGRRMGNQALNQDELTGFRVPLACYRRWLICGFPLK